ncbi:MAG: ABC transporter ATP-binding protein [Oligoflexales bacterium]
MIELKNVKKSFEGEVLLHDVSFKISQGERVSLLGPGSSGKSTILKLILGLQPVDAGSVSLMGHDMVTMSEKDKRQVLKHLGMSFQQGGLFDYMTVKENLFFAMQHMTDYDDDKMNGIVQKLLSTVKLPHVANMFPHELSGGMQRRVSVARALATDPHVAIFDEPTSGLDPVTSTIILNMISEIVAEKKDYTALVATSSSEIAIRFADRIILINEGRVVADGPWRELILNGTSWVKHFLASRLIGVDIEYARGLGLPEKFIAQHW